MQERTEDGRKKRRRRKDARPTEIISAAMTLWKDRGFTATRLEDVAKGAGIAKGTIYLYFASKEALFEAALQERLVATMEGAKGALQDFNGSTEALLLHFFAKVRAEMVEGGAFIFLKVLLSEGHRFPELVTRYEDVVLRRGMDAVRGILLRGVERGELRPEATDYDPRLVMAPAMMLALWGTVFKGMPALDAHEVMRQHVTTLMRSLGST